MVIVLLVLETSQYPSGLCPEEVALLVSLDGEHPSYGHVVLRFDLLHANGIKKTSLAIQDSYSKCFASANCV